MWISDPKLAQMDPDACNAFLEVKHALCENSKKPGNPTPTDVPHDIQLNAAQTSQAGGTVTPSPAPAPTTALPASSDSTVGSASYME